MSWISPINASFSFWALDLVIGPLGICKASFELFICAGSWGWLSFSSWFLSALCSYQLLVLITKLCHFWSFQNFPNFQTNPEWVGFAPKTPSNNLWTNSYCSPLVRPKNIPVKTLSLLVFPKHPKLPKLSN